MCLFSFVGFDEAYNYCRYVDPYLSWRYWCAWWSETCLALLQVYGVLTHISAPVTATTTGKLLTMYISQLSL